MPNDESFGDVLRFWFGDLDASGRASSSFAKRWFEGGSEFDGQVRERFRARHEAVANGAHREWLGSARGRLAYVIVLDQFSRHLFRGTAEMYAYDGRALEAALDAITAGQDRELALDERTFLYMPLVHSEKLSVQERAVDLFATLRDEVSGEAQTSVARSLGYAEQHRDIVRRFGRFPHRNALLGRSSTPEELDFLEHTPGFW